MPTRIKPGELCQARANVPEATTDRQKMTATLKKLIQGTSLTPEEIAARTYRGDQFIMVDGQKQPNPRYLRWIERIRELE